MVIMTESLQVTVELGVQVPPVSGLYKIFAETSCAGKPPTDNVTGKPVSDAEVTAAGMVICPLCSMEHSLFKAQGEIGAPNASEKSNGPETVKVKVVDAGVLVMEDRPEMVMT